jgi:hypothetical protein
MRSGIPTRIAAAPSPVMSCPVETVDELASADDELDDPATAQRMPPTKAVLAPRATEVTPKAAAAPPPLRSPTA